jgi:hypothetical protein
MVPLRAVCGSFFSIIVTEVLAESYWRFLLMITLVRQLNRARKSMRYLSRRSSKVLTTKTKKKTRKKYECCTAQKGNRGNVRNHCRALSRGHEQL